MKIFITGASGFIGTELLRQLQDTGHELFCLVRKTSPNFDKVRAMGVHMMEGDVRNKVSVCQGMMNCDWVIHLAAHLSFWELDNDLFRQINVEGTRNVMECALENKVQKVINVSAILNFGKPNDQPFNEDSQPGPRRFSRYGQTKYEGEQIAREMYQHQGLPLITIFPCAVLGLGDQKTSGPYISDVVNGRMPAQVFTDVPFTWVSVQDVAKGIIQALEKEGNVGEKYILGKEMITMGGMNQMISEIAGVELPSRKMPAWLALASASLLTGISRLTKKEPPSRMYIEQVRTMSKGIFADGRKAERALGITYTPVRIVLDEIISSQKQFLSEINPVQG